METKGIRGESGLIVLDEAWVMDVGPTHLRLCDLFRGERITLNEKASVCLNPFETSTAFITSVPCDVDNYKTHGNVDTKAAIVGNMTTRISLKKDDV